MSIGVTQMWWWMMKGCSLAHRYLMNPSLITSLILKRKLVLILVQQGQNVDVLLEPVDFASGCHCFFACSPSVLCSILALFPVLPRWNSFLPGLAKGSWKPCDSCLVFPVQECCSLVHCFAWTPQLAAWAASFCFSTHCSWTGLLIQDMMV